MGPRAIGDHGAPVSSPKLKPHPKKPMKGTRGISWGPLLTLGPRAVLEVSKWSVRPWFWLDTFINMLTDKKISPII
ncbi:unnamed protein product [Staurois parvus]|uniref:Uncharacterized protein n=1 Tax=Staurois parvus TaxID=386267 RepID=A0ABN9HB05_9NEOB|nr:unnamed protein product [Staurois parvus]